ncbi:hypothetical protein [Paenibacillus sp. y28]|uniref:hypothetical protein n=1 Tax=Paenibacillus sp. y28 TaxID=3129110 RepID=UPI003FA7A213
MILNKARAALMSGRLQAPAFFRTKFRLAMLYVDELYLPAPRFFVFRSALACLQLPLLRSPAVHTAAGGWNTVREPHLIAGVIKLNPCGTRLLRIDAKNNKLAPALPGKGGEIQP